MSALNDARAAVHASDQAQNPERFFSVATEAEVRALRDSLRALIQWAEAHERGEKA